MGGELRFLIALAFGVVLVPIARAGGLALGVVDRPQDDGLKIHRRAVSVLGGPAVVAATLAAVAVTGAWPGWAVAGSILAALAVGVVDDVRPLPAWVRVIALAAAGGVLVSGGWTLGVDGPVGAAALILLVLVTCNAVNLMDGQDGLAGGLGAIAAAGLGVVSLIVGTGGTDGAIAAATAFAAAGALVAFLLWNRPPARIFLGNGGAYGLGALLAGLVAMATVGAGLRGLLAAGLCLGPFAFELIFTVVRRLGTRTSLATGDREHSYDLLAARGLSRPAVTLVSWAAGAGCIGVAAIVAAAPAQVGVGLVVAVALVAAVGGMWLYRGRTRGSVAGSDGPARMRLDEPMRRSFDEHSA